MLTLRHLLTFIVLTLTGISPCTADIKSNSPFRYTSLFGDKYLFSADLTLFQEYDLMSRTSRCNFTDFCLLFEETLIIVPPIETLFSAKENRLILFKIPESLNIQMQVEYSELSVIDQKIKGYSIQLFKLLDDGGQHSTSSYFYSPEFGVVSFNYRFRSMDVESGEFNIVSEPLILYGNKGIFKM